MRTAGADIHAQHIVAFFQPHRFAVEEVSTFILCGYSMGHFYKDSAHDDIRALHTHTS
jgi:hypothetical protein